MKAKKQGKDSKLETVTRQIYRSLRGLTLKQEAEDASEYPNCYARDMKLLRSRIEKAYKIRKQMDAEHKRRDALE